MAALVPVVVTGVVGRRVPTAVVTRLGRAAHALKGVAMHFEATHAIGLCRYVEEIARGPIGLRLGELDECLRDLDQEMESLGAALTEAAAKTSDAPVPA